MPSQSFNTFWQGGELPPLEWSCLESFVANGHRLRLFSFDRITVPSGVFLESAYNIAKKEDLFLFEDSFSAYSNIFRYKFLLESGGWWIDSDVYCLTDDVPDCRYAWAHEDVRLINGAILKFPQGDRSLEGIKDEALRINAGIQFWGELGPNLLTKHLSELASEDHFGSRRSFYPIHWIESFLFWLPEARTIIEQRIKTAHFVHLWSSVLRRYGIDVKRAVPAHSFLAQLYDRYPKRSVLGVLGDTRYHQTLGSIWAYLNEEWVRAYCDDIACLDFSELLELVKIAQDKNCSFNEKIIATLQSQEPIENR